LGYVPSNGGDRPDRSRPSIHGQTCSHVPRTLGSTDIDGTGGRVRVKTEKGVLSLHFPPSALQSVKKGDHVSVELGLQDHGPAGKK